jgi:hypothetical protein
MADWSRIDWRVLIEAHREQLRRLAELEPGRHKVAEPNAGATEAQLEAAEGRLGHPLDPV